MRFSFQTTSDSSPADLVQAESMNSVSKSAASFLWDRLVTCTSLKQGERRRIYADPSRKSCRIFDFCSKTMMNDKFRKLVEYWRNFEGNSDLILACSISAKWSLHQRRECLTICCCKPSSREEIVV